MFEFGVIILVQLDNLAQDTKILVLSHCIRDVLVITTNKQFTALNDRLKVITTLCRC
jgi:hypothetical protein